MSGSRERKVFGGRGSFGEFLTRARLVIWGVSLYHMIECFPLPPGQKLLAEAPYTAPAEDSEISMNADHVRSSSIGT